MNKYLIPLGALSIMASATVNAEAHPTEESDRVEIEWKDPKSYSDVRSANQPRTRFRESTFKKLEQHLEKLAIKLPEGQTLKLTVTDLDLAGQVWPGHMVGLNSTSDVRMIKRIDIPRMNFAFQLLNASGNVLKEGEEKLKDMNFQDHINRHFNNDSLRYEKKMLDDWFKDTFELPK